MFKEAMTTADWIQTAVGFLAFCGVIVAVVAVVLSNRQARLLYETGRFDKVVDCVAEMTLVASKMKSAVIPLMAVAEPLYTTILTYKAERDRFKKDLSREAHFDVRIVEIDSVIATLHDVVEQLEALSGKFGVLGRALPDRLREGYLEQMNLRVEFLSQSVMLMYLTTVLKHRSSFDGVKGRRHFEEELVSIHKGNPIREADMLQRLKPRLDRLAESGTAKANKVDGLVKENMLAAIAAAKLHPNATTAARVAEARSARMRSLRALHRASAGHAFGGAHAGLYLIDAANKDLLAVLADASTDWERTDLERARLKFGWKATSRRVQSSLGGFKQSVTRLRAHFLSSLAAGQQESARTTILSTAVPAVEEETR